MACIETDDDEDLGPLWQCECGYWNVEADDECYSCGLFWE